MRDTGHDNSGQGLNEPVAPGVKPGRIILVTGGCRSGKSSFAQKLAESGPGQPLFVATCLAEDGEMRSRIARHQADRGGRGWRTVEEPRDLASVVRKNNRQSSSMLLDCLTIWIANLMFATSQSGATMTEDAAEREAAALISECRRARGNVIIVTNEVGQGTVPENRIARNFRDLVGRCNQTVAAAADTVVWMVSGIPSVLKGDLHVG